MTNQQAYKELTKARIEWDRQDFQTIVVYTVGYRTQHCYNIEKFLSGSKMVAIDRRFDRLSGQTITTYRHQVDVVLNKAA